MQFDPVYKDINAALRISERGLLFVMRYEGFRPRVYTDIAGKLTIGFGHKLVGSERFEKGISKEEAEHLLARDIAITERAIHACVSVHLTQPQYDAISSLVYNIGAGAFSASTLLKLLNSGNYLAAAGEIMRWNKIRKNGSYAESPGLSARRAAERTMFCEKN